MSQELTNQTTVNLPASPAEEADHLLAATEGHEQLLKFVKGKYKVGEDEIPLGEQFVVHANQLVFAWVKFVDGEVAERRMGKAAEGYRPPERKELGDTDEAQWDMDDGERRDPWVFQHLLPFEHLESGEVVIFATGSIGGRFAVDKLVRTYARRVKRKHSGALPIVSLQTRDMPTKKYGDVPAPQFEVIGWEDAPGGDANMSVSAELDDKIPF
jgi:hypothetical protein